MNLDRDHKTALEIARQVAECSGAAFFVGGYVRDKLLGIENKDIDMEIHGIEPRELCKILDGIGQRIEIGESFGIYSLKGTHIDVALPRKEKCIGGGHRGIEVSVDPHAGTYNAAKRRDFTVNAIMQDVLTGKVVDHFGGVEDLKNRVLRHVSDETFAQDPLRVLRAAQFAARLEFSVAEETKQLCRGIDLGTLSKERVEGELKKALLQARKPSVFFEVLKSIGALGIWFPEVEALTGVPQNIKYHQEGDVWTHTMMVLDAAAEYRSEAQDPYGLMLAALVHDLGKAVCMQVADGLVHAHGHDEAGVPLARQFMKRLTNEKHLAAYVCSLVKQHMKPNVCARHNSSVKKTNKMFDECQAKEDLIFLALSDGKGKIPGLSPQEEQENREFLTQRLEVYREYMARPHVTGEDLIESGLKPDENFSDILSYAHKLRLAGVEKQAALKQTLVYARKMKRQE